MKSDAMAGATSRAKSTAHAAQAASAKSSAKKGNRPVEAQVSDMDVRGMIETEAYLRAERRGFAAGAELNDWLDAEAAVLAACPPAGGMRAD